MGDVESCTGACAGEVWVVCEVPVRVIMKGKGSTVEELASTLSGREPGDEGDEIDEGGGVDEGYRVGDRDGVCEGNGVGEGAGISEGDSATIAVMIGAAVVDECKSPERVLEVLTRILVGIVLAALVVNHAVTTTRPPGGLLSRCNSTPSSFRRPRT